MITIVFATYNGAHTLPRMLDALTRLEPSTERFEVVAVDNASTDATREIILSYRDALPLQYCYCGQRGKNVALNSVMERLTGELIVFTDDDTICEPDWISRLVEAARSHPGFDIFGGTIRPLWEAMPSAWLIASLPLGMTYGLTAPELEPGEIFPGLIWGANMMVRRSVFDRGLRFDESIGPSAGDYAMGGETDFNILAASLGHACYFEPKAIVRHIIRAYQVEPEWVLARAFRYGRNVWNHERLESSESRFPAFRGVPRWRIRRYLEHRTMAALYRLSGRREAAFLHDWDVMFLRGYFEQARRTRA